MPLLFKGRAQLAGVVFPLICTMFAGVSPDIPALNAMGPVRVAATVLLHSADSSQLMPGASSGGLRTLCRMHAGVSSFCSLRMQSRCTQSCSRWTTCLPTCSTCFVSLALVWRRHLPAPARSYSYSHRVPGILVLISMAVFFRLVTFLLLLRGKHQARRR